MPESAVREQAFWQRQLHAGIVLPAIAVFALALGVGLINGVQMMNSDFVYSAPAHREGSVKGATVTVAAGPVTLLVDDGVNPRSYTVTLTEPLSLYNLLRLASAQTLLKAEFSAPAGQPVSLQSLDGIAPASGQWAITVNDAPVAGLSEISVNPGDTVRIALQAG